MAQESHDQNFKNLFLDFPQEALEWILPQTLQQWGPIRQIEFLRQEPKKRKLSDSFLALDMPILFSFEAQQILLWLVDFQEDKAKFSIYKLLRYQETVMIAQVLKEEGIREGKQLGIREGIQEGIQEGNLKLLSRQLAKKYHRSSEEVVALLEGLSAEDFLELGE